MTLADELNALALKVDGYARVLGICDQTRAGADAEEAAKSLRALAAKCDGKVLVEPYVAVEGEGCTAFFTHRDAERIGKGATSAEALADLQHLLDSDS